jgi:glycosyltransferase involved in cell wall biosynthesis
MERCGRRGVSSASFTGVSQQNAITDRSVTTDMKVFYADPGLRDNLGHHANSCRLICRELQRRGIEVVVLSMAGIPPELQAELKAIPLFRAYTYWQTDGDPISGWLNCFDRSARETEEDLHRLRNIETDDLLYLNSAQPAQFLALVRWSQSQPQGRRPHVVLEFGTDPGVDLEASGDAGMLTLRPRDYRFDPRAMFYRFAAGQLTEQALPRFHMRTFDSGSSAIYAALLARPVGVLPLLQCAEANIQGRVGRRPITVSVLGHQRPDKGYHLMPEIARLLLAHEPNIRLLIHNGAPAVMQKVQAELRAHASVETRIILNEETAGPELWGDLLGRSDLILCPYESARFVGSYSAVAAEAVAHAIPIVVPAGTSLSRLVDAFGGPGTTFARFDPASIVAATQQALRDFDAIAGRAVTAAERWDATMGVENMVSALLACCDTHHPEGAGVAIQS